MCVYFPADGKFPRARHILGFMGFLGFANVYAMRVNLSVAVVAMINHTAIPDVNGTVLDVCPMGPETNSTVPVVSATALFNIILFFFLLACGCIICG